ncbi:MAG: alpha/beta hydrolase [Bacteroidetes bacterium]|nr:alpha/beta hydrolase [Bacteroidota bacterium]
MENSSAYQFLKSSEFTLPYREYGHGPELLIAFHGFGRSGEDFQPLEIFLKDRYTIIAFDFFYHGPHAQESRKKMPVFTPRHMAEMIEKLLWERKKVRCSLIGYSQGGRIILGLVHQLPHRIYELFILAPDGMKKNRMRSFVGRTYAGRMIGRYVVKNPGLLFTFIRFFRRIGLINSKVEQFYLLNTHSEKDRYRIYHTWLALCKYMPNIALVHHYFASRPIRVEFLFGKYDTIIPLQSGIRFTKKMSGNINIHILECGHDILQQKKEIADIILKPVKSD